MIIEIQGGLLTLICALLVAHTHGAVARLEKQGRFQQIALKANTDKVTKHQYGPLYEKYMGPIQHRSLRLLEVGLGCNMEYGAGHSLQVCLLIHKFCLQHWTYLTQQ